MTTQSASGAPPAPAPPARDPALVRWALLASAVALLVIIAWSVAEAGDVVLSIPEAVLLGVVEGLTEFLPISSTGHLTVTQDLLGLTDTEAAKEAADAYAVAIQAGAILAVLGIYRRRIGNTVLSLVGRGADQEGGRRLAAALALGFGPFGVVAFLVGDQLKEHLFGIWPVVAAWFVGGIVILLWPRPDPVRGRALELISTRDAVIIGFAQTIALWPGISRSLVVILACLVVGLSLAAAVEFAFLLGLVTLGTATIYETLDKGRVIVDEFGVAAPTVGFVAAFLSAAAAVVWMVGYVQRRGLAPFGWYRIAVALIVAALALTVL